MIEGVRAVAFDIDGTLYPSWKINILMCAYVLKHFSFFAAFNRVRRTLHARGAVGEGFFTLQAELLAGELGVTPEAAKEAIDRLIYAGFKPYFQRIRPHRDALGTVRAFKAAGLKIALLSDFPPDQKGDVWGIAPLCDAVIGTEDCGALKPSPLPFQALSSALALPPEAILYVGNSVKIDVRGARAAGLKTAFILPLWRRILSKPPKEADISFKTYRQLCQFVLE
ncbi:MAG: HAD family hydrolase [Spirochaetaceae bacterium]|jgi:putative hydrolase of the HAD superfamily|nr:HAD family hydrolase [Spirochaetaceae bacterium]